MYFPQLFFFSIILSLWIIKIVFFITWMIFKKRLIDTKGIIYIWYRIKIKIKFIITSVLPILNFLTI